jgi:hypothetical protein
LHVAGKQKASRINNVKRERNNKCHCQALARPLQYFADEILKREEENDRDKFNEKFRERKSRSALLGRYQPMDDQQPQIAPSNRQCDDKANSKTHFPARQIAKESEQSLRPFVEARLRAIM